jgi:hypothetical protein
LTTSVEAWPQLIKFGTCKKQQERRLFSVNNFKDKKSSLKDIERAFFCEDYSVDSNWFWMALFDDFIIECTLPAPLNFISVLALYFPSA